MKGKALLLVFLLASMSLLYSAGRAQDYQVNAGPDRTVYTGQIIAFSGSVSFDTSIIINVEWNFNDGTPLVTGSDPAILTTTTHVFTTPAVYNVTLSVKINSALNLTVTDTAAVSVLQNRPPIADAGPDQVIEQTSPAGGEATLNASGSYDFDGDQLTYNWTWTGGATTGVGPTEMFVRGTTTVTLTVSDGQYTATDTVDITVRDTTPPTVNAGPDATVEQESYEGTEVTLHGIANDVASVNLTYAWIENNTVLGHEANLTYTFNLGTHILALNVTDESGNTGSDTVVVKVIDTKPPVLTISATPRILWPPNHKYVTIRTNVSAVDICDPSPTIKLVSVRSNEPGNSIGDGNTVNDIVIVNKFTIQLRAERAGTGTGRTYTITYQATDKSGNTATASIKVTVPHNQ